ncbi:MAG TPA: hypothetical protein VF695_15500 [Sphingomonas sp.]|jgi:hypothetical protein
MAGLSNIFGGSDDSSSSSDQGSSGSIVTDLTSTVGLGVDSSQSNYNEDEDGNISAQQNDNSLDFDTSTDGLLGAVGDQFSSSDESTS